MKKEFLGKHLLGFFIVILLSACVHRVENENGESSYLTDPQYYQYLADQRRKVAEEANLRRQEEETRKSLEAEAQRKEYEAKQAALTKKVEKQLAEASAKSELPKCDSKEVAQNLEQLVEENSDRLRLKELRKQKEVFFLLDENKRVCSATGYFNTGAEDFVYTISWVDTGGKYWVEIQKNLPVDLLGGIYVQQLFMLTQRK